MKKIVYTVIVFSVCAFVLLGDVSFAAAAQARSYNLAQVGGIFDWFQSLVDTIANPFQTMENVKPNMQYPDYESSAGYDVFPYDDFDQNNTGPAIIELGYGSPCTYNEQCPSPLVCQDQPPLPKYNPDEPYYYGGFYQYKGKRCGDSLSGSGGRGSGDWLPPPNGGGGEIGGGSGAGGSSCLLTCGQGTVRQGNECVPSGSGGGGNGGGGGGGGSGTCGPDYGTCTGGDVCTNTCGGAFIPERPYTCKSPDAIKYCHLIP